MALDVGDGVGKRIGEKSAAFVAGGVPFDSTTFAYESGTAVVDGLPGGDLGDDGVDDVDDAVAEFDDEGGFFFVFFFFFAVSCETGGDGETGPPERVCLAIFSDQSSVRDSKKKRKRAEKKDVENSNLGKQQRQGLLPWMVFSGVGVWGSRERGEGGSALERELIWRMDRYRGYGHFRRSRYTRA